MTSMESSDVMAKRASENEEKVESSLMKKRKAEDSGSEWESESESESEDEGEEEIYKVGEEKLPDGSVRVFTGGLLFTYVPKPEPVWDVDSFDELGYESDPKVRACYSDEDEYAEYRKERIQALESKGFLPDHSRHIHAIEELDESFGRNMTKREYLAKLAKVCVDKLNLEKGTTVEFVRVVKSNMSGGGRWKLYITFMAKEYPDGPEVEYQAKLTAELGLISEELTAEHGRLITEEEAVYWPKTDEEEDDSSSDSDSDSGSDSEWAQYSRPETEPEWDVDSFDGCELKVNPRIRKLYSTQQLYDEYYNKRLQAFKSKGFLLDLSGGIYHAYRDGEIDEDNHVRDLMEKLANVCVKKYNETKGMTLELVKVVRATEGSGLVGKSKLYITFMAREYHEGPLVEYQAKVLRFRGDVEPPFPILCRPSPKPEI